MPLLNRLFGGKNKKEKKPATSKEEIISVKETPKATPTKTVEFRSGGVLVSPHTAEKALMGQKLNQYVFKVSQKTNKISVAKEIKRVYNVKVIKVNIVNIPKKARRVGKTQGFRAGYKKAIVTLTPGQTIEAAK